LSPAELSAPAIQRLPSGVRPFVPRFAISAGKQSRQPQPVRAKEQKRDEDYESAEHQQMSKHVAEQLLNPIPSGENSEAPNQTPSGYLEPLPGCSGFPLSSWHKPTDG